MAGLETVLIPGEGDGRFLGSLLKTNGSARITCIDVSTGMTNRARRRIQEEYPDTRYTLNWQCRDILDTRFEVDSIDAVVTHFLLDCFTTEETRGLIQRLGQALRPNGLWFWSDFVLPDGPGPGRVAFARTYQGLLYWFFRWQTGISARRLPPIHRLMTQAGWSQTACRRFLAGTIESAVWVRA
jgi:ubiquinone/menaquinone biosynthesis C-methylase UbiE